MISFDATTGAKNVRALTVRGDQNAGASLNGTTLKICRAIDYIRRTQN